MSRPLPILELRSVRGTGGGPEKTILRGAAIMDQERFAVTVCYIRDLRDRVFDVGRTAAGMPVDYVEVHERCSADPRIGTSLRRLVRSRGIRIIHSHEYKTDLIALLLAGAEGAAAVATVHGWTGHTLRERAVYYPADKLLLRRFPQVIAVSSEIRDELLRWGADPLKVTTILNGIDHRMYRRRPERRAALRHALGLGHNDLVVGAVGRLEPQKRFDVLVDVCAELHRRRPDLRLLIAGDGSQRRDLAARAARLSPPGMCRLLGHREDVSDVLHTVDVFVQSSVYEGTPNAVLEAMALETPIVATDVGGTRELARPGVDALLVPALDRTALAAAIETTLNDPAAAAARARAARRRVETELSFDTRMANIAAVYDRLAQRLTHRPLHVAAAAGR